MSLKERVKADLNQAVKAGNGPKKTALRDIISKVQTAQTADGRKATGDLSDSEYLACVAKVDNEYRQSIDSFTGKPGYEARLLELQEERIFVEAYLPKKMTEAEINNTVVDFLKDTSFVKKDMGIVIKALNAKFPNQIDGKTLASIVGKKLI